MKVWLRRYILRRTSGMVAVLLLVFVGSCALGGWLGPATIELLPGPQTKTAKLKQEILSGVILEQELRTQISHLEAHSQVLTAAEKESRVTILRQQERIQELLRNNSLYQKVMADSQQLPYGIRVHGVQLRPISDQHYRYLITVQQFTSKLLPEQVRGHAVVKLVGTNAQGKSEAWPLHHLANVSEKEFALDFRYFQHLEGHLRLPAGFTPEHVAVDLQQLRTGKSQKTSSVSGKFVWAPGEVPNGLDWKS